MKTVSTIVILLLAGTLWGLAEILPLPTAIHCALGVLFLTIARILVPRIGTGILIGLVVCVYKTASVTFMECQWAGVLSLAGSFEIMVLLFHSRLDGGILRSIAVGVGTCALALILFIGWALLLAEHPYWIEGGWPRITDYALYTTAPAMLLSVLLAPLGRAVGEALLAPSKPRRSLALLFGGVAITLCWSFALLA